MLASTSPEAEDVGSLEPAAAVSAVGTAPAANGASAVPHPLRESARAVVRDDAQQVATKQRTRSE